MIYIFIVLRNVFGWVALGLVLWGGITFQPWIPIVAGGALLFNVHWALNRLAVIRREIQSEGAKILLPITLQSVIYSVVCGILYLAGMGIGKVLGG